VVVDFFATWCGPCKRIAPFIEELSNKHTNVVFLKVDVDELGETSAREGVSAMPTFYFYKGGKKVGDVVGASNAKIQELVEKHK
jgi:thioredoxin 1